MTLFRDLTGLKPKRLYPPVVLESPRRPLKVALWFVIAAMLVYGLVAIVAVTVALVRGLR